MAEYCRFVTNVPEREFNHLKHIKKVLFFAAFLCLILYPLSKPRLHSILFQHDIDSNFSFSAENGFYTEDLRVSMTLSSPLLSRMRIYYTLDGSTPDSSSTLYTEPLTFSSTSDIQSVNVRAVVCDNDGKIAGGPYNACYFVGQNAGLWTNALVVSLTSEEEGLYSPETGILYPMAVRQGCSRKRKICPDTPCKIGRIYDAASV